MDVLLIKKSSVLNSHISIGGSKSESNRLLILQKLFGDLQINNLSTSQDTQLLQKALSSDQKNIDIHHAGTAMRFLTAFFACQPGREVILTGSTRMKERPIKILVDALKMLGADIEYVENEGFPPLKITGRKLTQSKVTIDAGVSSQYITALLLIAPKLENGLEITLTGNKTSFPYLQMTLDLLTEMGVEIQFFENKINISPYRGKLKQQIFTVESDWSSASYFYEFCAFSTIGTTIKLSSFSQKSKQGDAILQKLFKNFGVTTNSQNNFLMLEKTCQSYPKRLQLNLQDTPDIAQTLAVCCFGLNILCDLSGLHTLKIKETDRLLALKNEISKLGGICEITDDSFHLKEIKILPRIEPFSIETYSDHRMAMAFAPLALLFPLIIKNTEVVEKSYPQFWKDIQKLGIQLGKSK